jgi:hypothetical protein
MDGNIPSGFKSSTFVGMDASQTNSFPITTIDPSAEANSIKLNIYPI